MPYVTEFLPNWASMPGDTIADILSRNNLSLSDFSKMMDSSINEVKMLLNGFISINEQIAKKLNSSLGGSIEFWMNREKQYRNSIERLKQEEEQKWLKELPLKDIKKNGRLTGMNVVDSCLEFFNVPDVWTWRKKYSDIASVVSFRKSTKIKSKIGSLATWIREGEIQADKIICQEWNPKKFSSQLSEIKGLSRQKDPNTFFVKLRSICADCGVKVSIVPTPEFCAASGAAKFTTDNHGLIILSLRYKSDDQFWFTFFHEAGHLLLHGDKETFIDEEILESNSKDEIEANDFALDILFPDSLKDELKNLTGTLVEIKKMANKAGVSLGIVVGQLQHNEIIPQNHFNALKRRYDPNAILNLVN